MIAHFVPAILERERDEFMAYLSTLARYSKYLHIDFADQTLVANRTVLPAELNWQLPDVILSAHLMVNEPTQYFADLSRLGFDEVIVHVEATERLETIGQAADQNGLKFGLALNPETDLMILPSLANRLSVVQLMAIHPGFGNQPFLSIIYERLRQSKALVPGLTLAVDGGVRVSNAKALLAAGATTLVAGKGGYELGGNIEAGLKEWERIIPIIRA